MELTEEIKEVKPSGYWNYERCYEAAKQCKNKTEFSKKFISAYGKSKKKQWLKDYTWFEKGRKDNGYWNYEHCYEAAKQCKNIKEFRKRFSRGFVVAEKNDWIKDYTWIERQRTENGFWTYETCKEESKKYKTYIEFKRGSSYAFSLSVRNKWLKDFEWLSSSKKIKWTYETCKEESKKFDFIQDFSKNSSTSYTKSKQNDWLKDFVWLKETRKSKNYWTYEKCKEIALNYKTFSDFSKNNEYVYKVSLKNKWLKDFVWLKSSKQNITYEICLEESKKYHSLKEFKISNISFYRKSCRKGWIENFTWLTENEKFEPSYEECFKIALKYDFFKEFQTKEQKYFKYCLKKVWLETFYWLRKNNSPTYEECLEEAQKYKTKKDFQINSPKFYNRAKYKKWITEYYWFNLNGSYNLDTDKVDSVYAYEFKTLNAVYVGRTLMCLRATRDRNHRTKNDDSVVLFAKKHKSEIPEMKILEENLTINEGSLKEGIWLQKYIEEGWQKINRTTTGSIGAIGRGKWSYENCFEEAKKYNTLKDFRESSPSCYSTCSQHKWIKNFDWLKHSLKKKPDGYWTYERCFEEAKKYKSKKEFMDSNWVAYTKSLKKGWIQEYSWFETYSKPKNFWNEKTCFEEAKKYQYLKDFVKFSSGAADFAYNHKLLSQYTWFIQTKKPLGYWSEEKCTKCAKECNTKSEFLKKYSSAYTMSKRKGWFDKFIWLK